MFRDSIRSGPPVRSRWLSRSEMPIARVRLPGPRQSSGVENDSGRRRDLRETTTPHEGLALERFERANEYRPRANPRAP